MSRTRSGEPIHRSSRARGTFESAFWRQVAPATGRTVQLAAERYERTHRKKGARMGPIGHVGLDLLGLLTRLQLTTPSGRLEPSYLWMAKALRRSIDAIWRALGRLEACGLLQRIRRVEPVEDGEGWRWAQTSNAYRLLVPGWLRSMLPVIVTEPPPPADIEHEAEASAATMRARELSLEPEAYARDQIEDGPLARSLATLGGNLRTHDSAERNESPPVSSLSGVALSGDNMDCMGAPAAPSGLGGGRTAKPGPD